MTANKFFPNPDHAADLTGRFPATTRNAQPEFSIVHPHPGEKLGDIVRRAYGANTHELRQRILRANATLEGPIIAPHG